MSFSPFNWLRNAARNAVLGGVQDALVEVAGPETSAPPMTLGDLQQRLALPAPQVNAEDDEQPARKRK